MTSAADRDVVMGPPPVPGSSSGSQLKPKDGQEISEKYKKLKRRFFELEEKHKETSTELQRSGERNVKMREERNILLDRIIELETEGEPFKNGSSSASPPSLQPSSSAFPRTFLNARSRTSPVANLRDAHAEDNADSDPDTSRHLGSETHRRGDDDSTDRYEEDSRDSRNGDLRSRGSLPNSSGSHQGSASPNHSSPTGTNSHYATASSSSHVHLRHSPVPGNHASSYRDEYRSSSPRGREDVEMGDERGYDYPQPNSANAPRSSGSVQREHDYADRDNERRSNGDSDQSGQTINTPFPGRGEADSGHSPSRKQDPTPGPSRSTRRSSRVAAANQDRDVELEHTPRTRGAAKRGAPSSPAVGARVTRRESAALAAAAKAEAVQESASPSSPPAAGHGAANAASAPNGSTSQPEKYPTATDKPYASTSTSPAPLSHHLPPANPAHSATGAAQSTADANIDPALAGTGSGGIKQSENGSVKESSPMDNIVKVAEAAIAAQKAASRNATPSSSASPAPSQTQPSVTAGSSGSSSSASPSSYNPYMITTQMVPNKINTMGMASPPGMHPLNMNPYAMYYPPATPVTPVTPGTPAYPHPYANPYYYLTGPMPGPSGMYPPSPNFIPPSTQRPQSEVQRQAKPKRLKAHTVTSKNFSIPMVPRDKRGKPMLPLNVGIMTVINLGDVCMREHFHTERYIFPVGYEVTRRYLSTVDPNVEVVYHCTILDGGDGPKFQIVPSDVSDRPVIAGTATGAWSSIVKQANAIRNRQHSNSVSGPDFFGLGQNTIKHLIQELPNADRLRDYVWQTFVEGGPLGGRHAAVIPALPEEYDAAMPIGAYYPTDRDKRKRDSTGTPEAASPRGISHYPQHIIAQAEAQRAQQQALQQAQQMGAQPLKPGESSGLQQSQDATQPPGQPDGMVLPPLTGPGPASFQEYRPQAATSAARIPQTGPSDAQHGLHSPYVPEGGVPSVTPGAPPVPATFASIMNAYPASGAPPPAQ